MAQAQWPFVDPNTKKKVKFGSTESGDLINDGTIDRSVLLKECGGDLDVSCSALETVSTYASDAL